MTGLMTILNNCRLMCWIAAALIGLLALVLFSVNIGLHFFLAFVLALLFAGAAAYFIPIWFCGDNLDEKVEQGDGTAGATGEALSDDGGDSKLAENDIATADEAEKKIGSEPSVDTAKTDTDDGDTDDGDTGTGATVGDVSGTLLKGEEELASRKGEWRYQPEGEAAQTGDPAPTGTDTIPDYDKDGVHEGTDEGTKPTTLDKAREGGADNLKEIKGVGPKMEQMLNEMGFFHFDQIAVWTAQEVAWVDANLRGFHGRVSRDGWVDQAKILAAGGETEFSKRVDEGDVYE